MVFDQIKISKKSKIFKKIRIHKFQLSKFHVFRFDVLTCAALIFLCKIFFFLLLRRFFVVLLQINKKVFVYLNKKNILSKNRIKWSLVFDFFLP